VYEIFGDGVFNLHGLDPIAAFSREELTVIRGMMSRGINSPATSSVGRLFDAVASLIGLRQTCGFEGQAAMQLEFIADQSVTDSYPMKIVEKRGAPTIVDTAPMIKAIITDRLAGLNACVIAARFHNTLVDAIARIALLSGEEKIALSGGCFQNKLLTEHAVRRLRDDGFGVYWHQRVPPNDGGISLGQLAALARQT
jgi:hydrogenase maturation protein HypF